MEPKVSIIMGSTSDLGVMEAAAKILDEFEIPFEINALSEEFLTTWEDMSKVLTTKSRL